MTRSETDTSPLCPGRALKPTAGEFESPFLTA